MNSLVISQDAHSCFWSRPGRYSFLHAAHGRIIARSHRPSVCAGEPWPPGPAHRRGERRCCRSSNRFGRPFGKNCETHTPVSLRSNGTHKGVWAHTCLCVCVWCYQNTLTSPWSVTIVTRSDFRGSWKYPNFKPIFKGKMWRSKGNVCSRCYMSIYG